MSRAFTAISLIWVSVWGILLYAPPAMAKAVCTVYRFECLPEVNRARFETFNITCQDIVTVGKEKAKALAAKNIYFPGEKFPDTDTDTHTCTMHGRELRVTVTPEFADYQKNGLICTQTHPYAMKLNWWLDGVKVVDDLSTSFGCDGRKFIKDGDILLSLTGSVTHKKDVSSHPNIFIEAFTFNKGNYKVQDFSIKIPSPYKDKNNHTFTQAPLTNKHIHGEVHVEK